MTANVGTNVQQINVNQQQSTQNVQEYEVYNHVIDNFKNEVLPSLFIPKTGDKFGRTTFEDDEKVTYENVDEKYIFESDDEPGFWEKLASKFNDNDDTNPFKDIQIVSDIIRSVHNEKLANKIESEIKDIQLTERALNEGFLSYTA